MTPVDIEVLMRRAQLRLSPEQIQQVTRGWRFIEPMLVRVRGHNRDRMSEPAHVFRADAYLAESANREGS
ncbi:hypothetical protein AAGS40_27085 (plasmid) [Paraburkholderia sp. PREW-6R]|uniref:hypothetical protein n=1 Tax=Paraburkholderia sp. PREW-6R TaxID=3141544 RepID=UPI0031F529AC